MCTSLEKETSCFHELTSVCRSTGERPEGPWTFGMTDLVGKGLFLCPSRESSHILNNEKTKWTKQIPNIEKRRMRSVFNELFRLFSTSFNPGWSGSKTVKSGSVCQQPDLSLRSSVSRESSSFFILFALPKPQTIWIRVWEVAYTRHTNTVVGLRRTPKWGVPRSMGDRTDNRGVDSFRNSAHGPQFKNRKCKTFKFESLPCSLNLLYSFWSRLREKRGTLSLIKDLTPFSALVSFFSSLLNSLFFYIKNFLYTVNNLYFVHSQLFLLSLRFYKLL